MVLERHHSRRICLMLLALDTPKLWDRFSLGLESTGLRRLWRRRKGFERVTKMYRHIWQLYLLLFPHNPNRPLKLYLPVTCFRVQSFKDRSTSLSTNVTRQSLWSVQFPPPLSNLPKGPVTVYINISADRENRKDITPDHHICLC